jgi:two-component sensor histidine kinase
LFERGWYDALKAEVTGLLAREEILRQEYVHSVRRQSARLQEFEHRVFNGLQLVVSMLVLQAVRATPEAAVHLSIAAGRIAALGRVHQRLHSLDGQESVELKEYLQHLCEGLSSLLFEEQAGYTIAVQSGNLGLPATLGTPPGLIVNELITNSAKYAKGNIAVRVDSISPTSHSLSVLDDGPGLPAGFDPAKSKGLGMKIILSLVKDIGGELHIFPGDNGRGTRFTVTFSSSATVTSDPLDRDQKRCRDDEYDGVLFLHIEQKHAATSLRNPHCDRSHAGGD